MRVFASKVFSKFQRRERIRNEVLCDAAARAERGLIDASLGQGLIKQRVARPGQGRSAGYRTVIAYHVGARAVSIFGFAKSERDNVRPDELESLRELGASWLKGDDEAIDKAIADEALREVHCD